MKLYLRFYFVEARPSRLRYRLIVKLAKSRGLSTCARLTGVTVHSTVQPSTARTWQFKIVGSIFSRSIRDKPLFFILKLHPLPHARN